MRPKSNFDLYETEATDVDVLFVRASKLSRAAYKKELKKKHRDAVRLLLTQWPVDPKPVDLEALVRKYGAELVASMGDTPPSLVGLLCNRDVDALGPDRAVDETGRSALMFCCDPSAWVNLNEKQMGRLHSLDVLEDLVYAQGSWYQKDRRGLCPDDVCPEWLREELQELERQRNEVRAGNWAACNHNTETEPETENG